MSWLSVFVIVLYKSVRRGKSGSLSVNFDDFKVITLHPKYASSLSDGFFVGFVGAMDFLSGSLDKLEGDRLFECVFHVDHYTNIQGSWTLIVRFLAGLVEVYKSL